VERRGGKTAVMMHIRLSKDETEGIHVDNFGENRATMATYQIQIRMSLMSICVDGHLEIHYFLSRNRKTMRR